MKELGFYVRWGRVLPGREKEAVAFFDEVTRYYKDKYTSGWLTYFEPYLFISGDQEELGGFFLMKGPAARIIEIFEDPKRFDFNMRASQVVTHLDTEFLAVGTAVTEQIARFAEVSKVLAAV